MTPTPLQQMILDALDDREARLVKELALRIPIAHGCSGREHSGGIAHELTRLETAGWVCRNGHQRPVGWLKVITREA